MKKMLCWMVLFLMMTTMAVAETVMLDGTVVSQGETAVFAPAAGTVTDVHVQAGDFVQAGDVLASLKTTKVYAQQNGTVYIFGEAGDDAAAVASRFGAVAYIEADYQYSIAASTKNAYELEENKIVHPGEVVYLRCYTDGKRVGKGLVTTVSGGDYTVEITEGEFYQGETISIYRQADYANASRIGRANMQRLDPIAYTGTGCIVKYCVSNGQTVKKGDVLFETIDCAYQGNVVNGNITAPVSGVVTKMNITAGDVIAQDAVLAGIYPAEDMRIEVQTLESDLGYLTVGAAVKVELAYLADGEMTFGGVIEKISRIAAETEETEEASYAVSIMPDKTDNLFYGMNVTVITQENEKQ